MKIFDSSSVICILATLEFPKILDICKNNGYSIVVPLPVFEELKQNRNTFKKFLDYNSFQVINDFDQREYEDLQRRYPYLGNGEISVICCARHKMRKGDRYYCILDDLAGRKSANGLKLTGTIGLIKWQKDKLDLSRNECQDIHDALLESNFRIAPNIIAELLK